MNCLIHGDAPDACGECYLDALRKRDEARAKLPSGEWVSYEDHCRVAEKLQNERDEARLTALGAMDRAEKAERERDEARALLAQRLQPSMDAEQKVVTALRERNEAVDLAVKAIRGMFAAELLPSGHHWSVDWGELYEAAATNGWLTAEDLAKSRTAAMTGDYD